jgi:peptidoglycan/xylan/chitin deacetylase (PgdA/CDA1 family)
MRLMRLLSFRTVGLDSLFEAPATGRPFVVTFDDGYENFATSALPILEEHGFTSTVFVVSDLVGQDNEWDASQGDVRERLMNRQQILDAVGRGTEIGSHTMTHVDLAAVSESEAERQIFGSKDQLQQLLGKEVRSFCYPYGRKTQKTEELVRQAGYRCACSTIGGVNSSETNRFSLRRVNVRKDTTPTVLLFKLLRDFRRG